jgi:hypothetical protein
MDSASHIDACPIGNRDRYTLGDDHATGNGYSISNVDTDSESDADPNCHRFINVTSHCHEYLCSHRYIHTNIHRNDNAFTHIGSNKNTTSILHP